MSNIGNIYTDGTISERTKYPVARVSKVKDDAHIYDVLDTASAIKQGANIKLGKHVAGELQVRTAETPAVGDKIVFVCDVPLIYESYTSLDQAEYNYVNKAGKVTKAYEVGEHDVLGTSDYAIDATGSDSKIVEGNYIVVDGARGWKCLKSDTLEETLKTYGFLAVVIGFERYQYDTVVLFEVIRNETIAPIA